MDGNTSRLWHRRLSLYIAAALELREREAQNAHKRREQNASAKRKARGSKETERRSGADSIQSNIIKLNRDYDGGSHSERI